MKKTVLCTLGLSLVAGMATACMDGLSEPPERIGQAEDAVIVCNNDLCPPKISGFGWAKKSATLTPMWYRYATAATEQWVERDGIVVAAAHPYDTSYPDGPCATGIAYTYRIAAVQRQADGTVLRTAWSSPASYTPH